MQKQLHQATLTKATNGYDATFVMSATGPDRVADTFDPAAYKSLIGTKLMALWGHNHDQPCGYWENIRVKNGKLIGDIKLAGTNLGKMIKQLLADDVPLMASVGFRPKDYDQNDEGGLLFKLVDWLECSIVAVGAHQEAERIKAVAKEFNVEIDRPSINPGDLAMSGDPSEPPTGETLYQNAIKSLARKPL